MIDGVNVKKLKILPDERGRLMEMFREDDELFIRFGQVYLTTAYPGVVKAWHYHQKQTDHFNPVLVQIPPGVYHGFKCISDTEAMVINIPTEKYNYSEPDEFRVDPHSREIPYEWGRKDG